MNPSNKLLTQLPTNEFRKQNKGKRTEYISLPNATKRTKAIIDAHSHLLRFPMYNTQTYRILQYFVEGGEKQNLTEIAPQNLNTKFEKYLKELEEGKDINDKMSPQRYEQLVLYAYLKLFGDYHDHDDRLFAVIEKDHREYNPFTQNLSVLRHELGLEIYEYDIRAAVPSFIDQILKTNHRYNVYNLIDKKTFATLLNLHSDCEIMTYDEVINRLKSIYGDEAEKILTKEVYSERGAFAKMMNQYEEAAINDFVKANSLENYIRCHDAIYTLKKCNKLMFDEVQFVEKLLEPLNMQEQRFYDIIDGEKVITSATRYSEFLLNKGFTRVSRGDDEIHLIWTKDKSVEFFPIKTELVSYLKENVHEPVNVKEKIWNQIAKEHKTKLIEALRLMPSEELCYYKDDSSRINLPFQNGVYSIVKDRFELRDYSTINGYFSKTPSMLHNFQYTTTIGDFENFVFRASTKSNVFDSENTTFTAFQSMIGYMVSSYKNPSKAICIVLSDENANEDQRKGRRGKSLLYQAISKVRKSLYRGAINFDTKYNHYIGDVDESYCNFLIDDVPANFHYHDLFTLISGDVTIQPKGHKALTIPFMKAPKFMVTTNYIFRYNKEDASILGRFAEYKFTDYYTADYQPQEEFGKLFFDQWDNLEYNNFYSFISRCCKVYLNNGLIRIAYNKELDNQKIYCNDNNFEFIRAAILDYSKVPLSSFSVSDILEYASRRSYMREMTKNNVHRYIDAFINSEYNDLGTFVRKSDRRYYRQ
jgi:hypothetical protein